MSRSAVPRAAGHVPPRTIVIATLTALVVAGLLLVTVVLPAEYGIDPLGTGAALGLVALADARPGAISAQPAAFKRNAAEFILGPYEALEYKYRIEQGGGMVFSWQATGDVLYDFHSEPDGGPAGYAESFDKERGNQRHGTYLAPFSGIHGWYWENPGRTPVTITLTTSGFYSKAEEMRDGDSAEHSLQ